MPNEALARKIYSLQNKIVRELNNAHIFLEQAHPLLEEARARYEGSKSKSDRRYYVPSIDRKKFARRTDAELKEIYDHYTSSGLFEAFLVSSVSQFESFLADVLIVFLQHYPQRITEAVQGIPACPGVSAKDLMAAEDKEELVQRVLSDHVANVFRQRPSLYMAYLAKLVSVKNDPSFADYFEVAATRDLVVHNNNVVNALYLEKSGAKARGAIRQEKSKPLIDALHQWMILNRQKITDGSATAKALDYSLRRWAALTRFLSDGQLPVDNNHIENQIRPIAIGRNNWLFAGSLRAGKRAAAVMSLIQSARLNGHDPYAYLKDVLTRLPTQRASQIHELLPHRWQPQIQSL